MSENTDESLENNMLEDYMKKQSEQNHTDIISKLLKGEKIFARVCPSYKHLERKVFKRQLRISKSKYSKLGYDIYIKTPVFARYVIADGEIIEIL